MTLAEAKFEVDRMRTLIREHKLPFTARDKEAIRMLAKLEIHRLKLDANDIEEIKSYIDKIIA